MNPDLTNKRDHHVLENFGLLKGGLIPGVPQLGMICVSIHKKVEPLHIFCCLRLIYVSFVLFLNHQTIDEAFDLA